MSNDNSKLDALTDIIISSYNPAVTHFCNYRKTIDEEEAAACDPRRKTQMPIHR